MGEKKVMKENHCGFTLGLKKFLQMLGPSKSCHCRTIALFDPKFLLFSGRMSRTEHPTSKPYMRDARSLGML